MVSLKWMWIVVGAAMTLMLPISEASATCTRDCNGKMVLDDCSEAPQTDDLYSWTRSDEIRVLVSCTEECCGGGPDCSTSDASPWLETFALRDVTTDSEAVEVEWETEQACDGFLVLGTTALEPGREYLVAIEGGTIAKLEVMEEAESAGCSVGSRTVGAPLFLLGLVGWASRRRRQRRADWRTAAPSGVHPTGG